MTVQSKSAGFEMAALGAMILGTLVLIAFHVSPLWGYSHLIWYGGLMGLLALLAFINASVLNGVRHAALFLVCGAVIGFTAEYIGTTSGAIFGPYTYGSLLGPKIMDVPIAVPLCWFAVVYLAHCLANVILTRQASIVSLSIGRILALSLLTAMFATGFDLAVDPVMSGPNVGAWTWTDGGDFFGVPFKNFQGWLLVSFLIDFTYRMTIRVLNWPPRNHLPRSSAVCAIAAWVSLSIGFMLIGDPVESQLIALFTMFLIGLIALLRLLMDASELQ